MTWSSTEVRLIHNRQMFISTDVTSTYIGKKRFTFCIYHLSIYGFIFFLFFLLRITSAEFVISDLFSSYVKQQTFKNFI